MENLLRNPTNEHQLDSLAVSYSRIGFAVTVTKLSVSPMPFVHSSNNLDVALRVALEMFVVARDNCIAPLLKIGVQSIKLPDGPTYELIVAEIDGLLSIIEITEIDGENDERSVHSQIPKT